MLRSGGTHVLNACYELFCKDKCVGCAKPTLLYTTWIIERGEWNSNQCCNKRYCSKAKLSAPKYSPSPSLLPSWFIPGIKDFSESCLLSLKMYFSNIAFLNVELGQFRHLVFVLWRVLKPRNWGPMQGARRGMEWWMDSRCTALAQIYIPLKPSLSSNTQMRSF